MNNAERDNEQNRFEERAKHVAFGRREKRDAENRRRSALHNRRADGVKRISNALVRREIRALKCARCVQSAPRAAACLGIIVGEMR